MERLSRTVTFLFTDIEGSTRRWEDTPESMSADLARHDAIVEGAITSHGGVLFFRKGDRTAAAFASARDALSSAPTTQTVSKTFLGLSGSQSFDPGLLRRVGGLTERIVCDALRG